jgi:hypothetical protein
LGFMGGFFNNDLISQRLARCCGRLCFWGNFIRNCMAKFDLI